MNKPSCHIVGAGLAGSEAAWFLASRGVRVILHEMRPECMTEAHQTAGFAELVCSNSLKSKNPHSAPGMLKAEMRHAGSLILSAAEQSAVPAGDALGVDRDVFSKLITDQLKGHPLVTFEPGEVREPFSNETITCLATGPLTSESLSNWISGKLPGDGGENFYFYDAIAPIIDASTLDREIIFAANRYDKGEEEAYLNCPFTEAEYHAFIDALTVAEKVPPKKFEKEKFFQGCQPIEAIAATGRDTLRFGPMKPVGLTDPRTGKKPYAVVQLRPENRAKTAYNLVGFQTKLKYGEQSRIFRMIPGLAKADFFRLGSIHRNSYLCAPKHLRTDLSLKGHPRVYMAGQMVGVEGYLESAACGLLAGLFIYQRLLGLAHVAPPANTALGALLRHVVAGDEKNYQPSNIHFGLFDPSAFSDTNTPGSKDAQKEKMARESGEAFRHYFGLALASSDANASSHKHLEFLNKIKDSQYQKAP